MEKLDKALMIGGGVQNRKANGKISLPRQMLWDYCERENEYVEQKLQRERQERIGIIQDG